MAAVTTKIPAAATPRRIPKRRGDGDGDGDAKRVTVSLVPFVEKTTDAEGVVWGPGKALAFITLSGIDCTRGHLRKAVYRCVALNPNYRDQLRDKDLSLWVSVYPRAQWSDICPQQQQQQPQQQPQQPQRRGRGRERRRRWQSDSDVKPCGVLSDSVITFGFEKTVYR
jgi:hypothetical protein